jgi:hypothetical protein
MARYFNDILFDERGDREGFPPEVMAEIFALSNYHESANPSRSALESRGVMARRSIGSKGSRNLRGCGRDRPRFSRESQAWRRPSLEKRGLFPVSGKSGAFADFSKSVVCPRFSDVQPCRGAQPDRSRPASPDAKNSQRIRVRIVIDASEMAI